MALLTAEQIAQRNAPVESPLKIAAREAQARGFAIFGLQERKKEPTPGSAGFKDATKDASILSNWDKADYNIGIGLGESDLTVLDFDTPDSVPEWIQNTRTLKVKTARGLHVYFRGARPTKKLLIDGKIVGDLKSTGGYVLAAGSIHPDGPTYTITDNSPIINTPERINELLKSGTNDKPVDISPNGERVPRGSHDTELTRIAGKMRHIGMEEETIFNALVEIVEKRFDNYGSDYVDMCRKHAKNIVKKPVGKDDSVRFEGKIGGTTVIQPTPRSQPEPDEEPEETFDNQDVEPTPEFPVFTGALTNLARALYPSIPLEFKQAGLIARWGILRSGLDTIHGEEHLQPRPYIMLVSLPNQGKTAANNETRTAMELVVDLALAETAKRDQSRPTPSVFGDVNTTASVDSGPFLVSKFYEMNKEAERQVQAGKTSDTASKIMLDPDEISDVFEKGRSSNTRISTLLTEFLKLHSGNRTGSGTRQSGDRPVEHAHLAILGGVTRSKYQAIWVGTGAGGDGLMSRFIPITSNAPAIPAIPLQTDTVAATREYQRLAKLLNLPPQQITFSPEAVKMLTDWWASIDTRDKHTTRVLESAKQLLIVLAVTNAPEDHKGTTLTVGTDLMSHAIAFGDYIIAARKILNPPDSYSSVQAMENGIIEWMQKNASKQSPKTRNECRRGVHPQRRVGGLGAFKIAWDTCTSLDVLKLRERANKGGGGGRYSL